MGKEEKKILEQYVDACKMIEETEEEIRILKKRKTIYDKVYGSSTCFPYNEKGFIVSGIPESNMVRMQKEIEVLKKRKGEAMILKDKAEQIISKCPLRIQRIISFRIFERMKWNDVADAMGRNATGESIRKEYNNYFREK